MRLECILSTEHPESTNIIGKHPSHIPFLSAAFSRTQDNLLELGTTFFHNSYKYTDSPTIKFSPDGSCSDTIVFNARECHVIKSASHSNRIANHASQIPSLFKRDQFRGGLFRVRFKMYGNAGRGVITISAVSMYFMFHAQ